MHFLLIKKMPYVCQNYLINAYTSRASQKKKTNDIPKSFVKLNLRIPITKKLKGYRY